jgi:hypothetical protein
MIEFKSYEQGRSAFQGRSIGGFWFCEQFPADIFIEVLRGCREYMFPGGQFAEFTPIDPELCLWVEEMMEADPPGWGFYRCNTEMNKENLADGWYDTFFASISDDMKATRMTGALATFEGAIFPNFQPSFHVYKGGKEIPDSAHHFLGIDWGASKEHPFTCVFGCTDAEGDWRVYAEYWSNSQTALSTDHAKAIADICEEHGWPIQWQEAHQKAITVMTSGRYHQACADPSRPDRMNEFGALGIPIASANNDVHQGIECLRSKLKPRTSDGKPRLKIHESCTHLIEEMRKYRWLRSKGVRAGHQLNPGAARPQPLKRDDDMVDSLRYMIFTTEQQKGMTVDSLSHREWEQTRLSTGLSAGRTNWRESLDTGFFNRGGG